jgi:hypothetical protein
VFSAFCVCNSHDQYATSFLQFGSDRKSTLLQVQNKVCDVHPALVAFKEPLQHRRHLSLVLRNVALTDPSVQIIADIIARNHTIEVVDLSTNLITEKGAQVGSITHVPSVNHYSPLPLLSTSHFLFLRFFLTRRWRRRFARTSR